MMESENLRFWQKSWFMWLCLLFFTPVGIVLCYLNRERHPKWKLICGIFLILFVIGVAAPRKEPSVVTTQQVTQQTEQKQEENKQKTKDDNATQEQKNALRKAQSYSKTMHMSKEGIYNQLVQFEKFADADAKYAVEHVDANFNENAKMKAESYVSTTYMSKAAIPNQLVQFDKFTDAEAQYAVENMKADFNKAALNKARSYQTNLQMSRDAIYNQLLQFEQFTEAEAQYAIDNLPK